MSDGASMLSEEEIILLNALSYLSKREVIAIAGTCQRWRSIVRGPRFAALVRGLVEAHHPSLFEYSSTSSLNNAGWFDLFVRTDGICALVEEKFRLRLSSATDGIRFEDYVFGQGDDIPPRRPYASPTSGMTTTAIPNESGRFEEPVYYDWGANWGRVAELVETREVQQVLMRCVNNVSEGYYYKEWDDETIWPFLFVMQRRLGNGEQAALLKKFLTPLQVRELNDIAADQLQTDAESILSSDCLKDTAAFWASEELESGEEVNGDVDGDAEVMVDEMVEPLVDRLMDSDMQFQLQEAVEAIMYTKNGPVGDILLCTIERAEAFLPLNYILAKLVSPDGTKLKVCSGSGGYSVVYDEGRNIVFDNNYYFLDEPASKALEEATRNPIFLDSFDYAHYDIIDGLSSDIIDGS